MSSSPPLSSLPAPIASSSLFSRLRRASSTIFDYSSSKETKEIKRRRSESASGSISGSRKLFKSQKFTNESPTPILDLEIQSESFITPALPPPRPLRENNLPVTSSTLPFSNLSPTTGILSNKTELFRRTVRSLSVDLESRRKRTQSIALPQLSIQLIQRGPSFKQMMMDSHLWFVDDEEEDGDDAEDEGTPELGLESGESEEGDEKNNNVISIYFDTFEPAFSPRDSTIIYDHFNHSSLSNFGRRGSRIDELNTFSFPI